MKTITRHQALIHNYTGGVQSEVERVQRMTVEQKYTWLELMDKAARINKAKAAANGRSRISGKGRT